MPQNAIFDVFLSHNGDDKPMAVELGNRLRSYGLRVWLDVWELRPGLSWQQGILEGLSNSRACAVLIGSAGYGSWHKKETETALLRQGPEYPVIPVLLPGAPARGAVDAFLSLLTWVDFRNGIDDSEETERLIWGITGLRPDAFGESPPSATSSVSTTGRNGRFHIKNPRNGDLLIGPSIISGTGPPNKGVFLHFRAPQWDKFQLGASTTTDEEGQWAMPGFTSWHARTLGVGPYEIYVAGTRGHTPSNVVTIFYRDSTHANKVARGIGNRFNSVEVSYELHTAFIEATKLKKGRLISSNRMTGRIENIESLAAAAGSKVAEKLRSLIPRNELGVRVSIDASRRVELEPSTAWASYYAFPGRTMRLAHGPSPGLDWADLMSMRGSQMVWRLLPRVGQIPENPFGGLYESVSTYLEIRHDGYRPEFIPLDGIEPRTLKVRLSPALNKRIAVLNFPSANSKAQIAEFSQLIAKEMAAALESRRELSTYMYFSDPAFPRDNSESSSKRVHGPEIEIGNEVLTLRDVQAVQKHLKSFDTEMISGEGRHLQRKTLDIQYLIQGSYRLFDREAD